MNHPVSRIGKTHRINTTYKTADTSCISINDKVNLSALISSFLLFDCTTNATHPSVFFNISIHAPFEELNRILFSLFVCDALTDTSSGLTFSLPTNKPWKFFIEIPHTDKYQKSIAENYTQILPLLTLVSPNRPDEVTDTNYKLHIGDEEELVARFLKAYKDKSINRRLIEKLNGTEEPVDFDRLDNPDECREHIDSCINKHIPDLPDNKISKLSFIKFLYRRVRFFTHHYYRFNTAIEQLGATAMTQMIKEAKALAHINFQHTDYPRLFLVYDPNFSLHLLHDGWKDVPEQLRKIFNNQNPVSGPEFRDKNYFAKCLSWVIDIRYDDFMRIMTELRFILTENFTYKLFHIHERKLTKLALIIEGHTGVGKTFLLQFYSLLLNANLIHGPLDEHIAPRIRERTSRWLLTAVIVDILEPETNLLNEFLRHMRQKLLGQDRDDDNDDDDDNEHGAQNMHYANDLPFRNVQDFDDDDYPTSGIPAPVVPAPLQPQNLATAVDDQLLKQIKDSLRDYEYPEEILQYMWKTIMTVSHKHAMNISQRLSVAMYDHVTSQLATLPLIEASPQLQSLLSESSSISVPTCIKIFNEYLSHTRTKPLFYRLLLHPGVTEELLEQFMQPVCQLARQLLNIELVVFFDEVNTSSCLGLFKEMFMDGTLHGRTLPNNIFFTAAINPLMNSIESDAGVHRHDYFVHQLPQALENLKVCYGTLEPNSLKDYIVQKIAMFHVKSNNIATTENPFDEYNRDMLAESILNAQKFCEERLGVNSVSQREIQRCFNLIDYFWSMRFDNELADGDHVEESSPQRCIALALALIYYFRLPTDEDNAQREDTTSPSREQLARVLSRSIPDFTDIISNELERFVNTTNFLIPQGVAINRAIREHIFAIVVSIVTRTPLCIIGAPGQSKTLSFQIVLQNLQGPQLSPTAFCKRLPAIDPFFCLGSKYSRSEDIAYVFERAIKREQQYEQNRMSNRCVVFLDEASLPDEKKMVLKVLHPYLDECKVAFVAVANKSFDAANANRMICVYRSLPSEEDQQILAYGCLGLKIDDEKHAVDQRLQSIISGLCHGYRRILKSAEIPPIYHDRDFIYMLRELRFDVSSIIDDQQASIHGITPASLLQALEDNFNGIDKVQFELLVDTFFQAVREQCSDFRKPTDRRDVPTILRQSMKLDSVRRRLYGRYKLVIDESDDESAVRLLSQSGVLDLDPSKTAVFRMSDFPDDVNNELRNVEILSTIKLCMETGKTILMVNTGRIHGSLYDVFNQNFSIMATGDNRKIFSKVAIGPKTIDVVVHEDFQCIVHIKRSEFKEIPAPFLSRFQKYSLSVNDFYQIQLKQLPLPEQTIMNNVEEKAVSFVQHFGRQYFYGLNDNTLYSCLLSFIKTNRDEQRTYLDVHRQYSQLTLRSKAFIEQNPSDIQQCLLRSILSKLMQLVSPESVILKLPTFEDGIARWICTNYFHQQEHFNIESFIHILTSNPSTDVDNDDLLAMTTTSDEPKPSAIKTTTKSMIFTRTSSYIMGLSQQTKQVLFTAADDDDLTHNTEKIEILNLVRTFRLLS